ncbi:MAG: hypothetical protein P8Y02_07700 [Deinococcales bacterium]|jgi:hypothetical protein
MRKSLVVRVLGAGVGMALLLAGCGQQATPSKLSVLGGDMGAQSENVLVTRNGRPVTSATVSVNGTQLTLADASTGRYHGVLPSKLATGSQLDLVVTDGSQRVEAIGNVPEAPVVTSPANGSTIDATQPLPVTWTSASSPDAYELLVFQSGSSPVFDGSMGGSYRNTTIAANTLAPGYANGSLKLFAYNFGRDQVTGDAAAGSEMNIRVPTSITINTSP